MGDVHFFDLPVYRLSEDEFYRRRERQVDEWMYPKGHANSEENRVKDAEFPDRVLLRRARLEEHYGTWQFNEVIGHIRLFFCGTQVRGMYFAVDKQRVVRTERKKFVWLTDKLAPEVEVKRPFGHPEILAAVHEYISDCKQELPLRHIDTSVFDNIANHLDWPEILAKASFGRPQP